MDAAERDRMLVDMAQGWQMLRDSVTGLSDEQAASHPEPDRWSILDCVEHLAAVEAYMAGQLEQASPCTELVGSQERERKIAARAGDRSRRVPAPEMVRPSGRFATVAEALAGFESARARTLRWLHACPVDPRSLEATHPLIGPVNCYELLLMMALHPVRHAKQIGEIRAGL